MLILVILILCIISVIFMNLNCGKCKAYKYINQNIDIVEKKLTAENITYRIVERDGVSFPITKDYRPDRYNFTVTNNIITKVTKG